VNRQFIVNITTQQCTTVKIPRNGLLKNIPPWVLCLICCESPWKCSDDEVATEGVRSISLDWTTPTVLIWDRGL
jgi:hypothetical protein